MDIQTFLAHAVKLELDAEETYLKLVELTMTLDNRDAVEFFREMAGFSRMHRNTAMQRAGFDDSTDIHGIIDTWPDSINETPDINEFKPPHDLEGALALALASENRAVVFYDGVAQTTTDPQIRRIASEFAAEERGHVLALERFLGLQCY